MQYVKRIDGLRGLSVLAVLFYHLNLPFLKGGFIGVDIFFVISGFLITGVIQTSIATSEFSFLTFYIRRIKRLLPALYLMLSITAILAVLFFLPHEIKSIYQNILVTTVYVSNIFNYSKVNYFNTFYDRSPLLHTWSLSIEEQFYLIYPLILFFARKASVKKRKVILSCFTVSSFAASVYYAHIDNLYTFYYPQFRVWELGLGGITFLIFGNSIPKEKPVISSGIIYYGAILTILLSMQFCRADVYIPGIAALPAVLATCFVLSLNPVQKIQADVLESRFLVFFGLVSYSLYLWHQPVLAVMYKIYGTLNFMTISVSILLSVSIAFLSWKFVEVPTRKWKARPSIVFGFMAVLSALLISIGLYGNYSNGFMQYFLSKIPKNNRGWFVQHDAVFQKRSALWHQALKVNLDKTFPAELDFLIIGDSKGEDMNASFYSNNNICGNYTFYYLLLKEADMGDVAGAISNHTINAWIEKRHNEPGYLKKYSILKRIGTLKIKNVIFTCTWLRSTNNSVAKLINRLSENVDTTYVVSTSNWNDVTSLSYGLAKSTMTAHQRKSYLYNNFRDDFRRQGDELHALVQRIPNLKWVNKENAFCDMKAGECELFDDHKNAYFYDTGHLTFEGAKYFGSYIYNHNWFNLGRKPVQVNAKM